MAKEAVECNSNTTLVKVKWYQEFYAKHNRANSNTTLVKVKFSMTGAVAIFYFDSNTTLVKVKFELGYSHRLITAFKYNTC